MSEQQPPAGEPRYSDDGRFWWDGTRWNPVQAPPQAPAPSASVSVKSGNPFTSGMMGCFGVGCAILLVFGVMFAACSGMLAGAGNTVH